MEAAVGEPIQLGRELLLIVHFVVCDDDLGRRHVQVRAHLVAPHGNGVVVRVRLDEVCAVILGRESVGIGRVLREPHALIAGRRPQKAAEVLLRLRVRLGVARPIVLVRLAVHGQQPRVDAAHEEEVCGLRGLVRGRAPVVSKAVLPTAIEPLARHLGSEAEAVCRVEIEYLVGVVEVGGHDLLQQVGARVALALEDERRKRDPLLGMWIHVRVVRWARVLVVVGHVVQMRFRRDRRLVDAHPSCASLSHVAHDADLPLGRRVALLQHDGTRAGRIGAGDGRAGSRAEVRESNGRLRWAAIVAQHAPELGLGRTIPLVAEVSAQVSRRRRREAEQHGAAESFEGRLPFLARGRGASVGGHTTPTRSQGTQKLFMTSIDKSNK